MDRLLDTTIMTFDGGLTVTVTPRSNSIRLRLRRSSDGRFVASAPAGVNLTTVRNAIAGLLPRLREATLKTDRLHYHPDWTYTMPEGKITITTHNGNIHSPISKTACGFNISLPANTDFSNPSTTKAISNQLIAIAVHLAPRLIPLAENRAAELGISSISWETGKGRSVLGVCYRDSRRIRLSALLIFLPAELRTFIINHELAHLTHPNHSAEFHNLCNHYCNGQEKQLISRLRQFKWPIIR